MATGAPQYSDQPGDDGMTEQYRAGRRQESATARINRNFGELLQELRVAQTGVQILFAFLLTLPFTSYFPKVGEVGRVTYIVTIVAAASAAGLLIAPVAYHRRVFRKGRKPEVVVIADRLAQAGLGALLVAVIGALFLATDVVLGTLGAVLITGLVALLYVLVWYVLPVVNPSRLRSERLPPDSPVPPGGGPPTG
jgi:O-antigen/teichoic acid export membrane protein